MKQPLRVFFYCLILFAVALSGANVYSASKYESEPNETKETATSVTFGDKIVGSMWHALDYDWYSVKIPGSGLVSLTAYYEFPDGSVVKNQALYIELRNGANTVISDFYVDFEDQTPPYIRDINIPGSGTYYIVVHCPNTDNFRRDRYYITMSQGGGENAGVKILNEEDSVKIAADEESTATITALVLDEDGDPVYGAPVIFSVIEGDLTATDSDTGSDITTSYSKTFTGNGQDTTQVFEITSGIKEFVYTYKGELYLDVYLVNMETQDKDLIYWTYDPVEGEKSIETFDVSSDYFLEINGGDQASWTITIQDKGSDTTSDTTTSDTTNTPKVLKTITTDEDGKAQLSYKSSEKKGEFTIIASFGNDYDTFLIEQTAGAPAKIDIRELVEDPENDLLYINREYQINVMVTDKNNNSVEDGTVINLVSSKDSVTNTTLKLNDFTAETKNGTAKFTVSASRDVEYTLTASVSGDSDVNDTLTLKFNNITLSNIMAQPAYVLADGKTVSTISVRLSDSDGMAIGGEPIEFQTTCGFLQTNIVNTAEETAEETEEKPASIKGVAKVDLVAPFEPGRCMVTASYGTVELETPVEFYGDGTGSTTASILFESESNTIPANGTSSIILTATLTDSAGKFVAAGTPVKFEILPDDQGIVRGFFPNATRKFNGSMPAGGTVKLALVSEIGKTGRTTITCSSGGLVQSLQIVFTEVNADGTAVEDNTAFINLSAAPASIPADGKSSLMVSAELLTSANTPVPQGTEVIFYASSGKFSNGLLEFAAATTDDSGKVYAALISSTTAGTVEVWCYSDGIFQLTNVAFESTDVDTIIGTVTLSADPESIPADGSSSTSITAEIKDTAGNPVPSGTSITFTTSAGKFSNGTKTITLTTSGEAGRITVPLISATSAGYARIVANSSGATQTILIIFEGDYQESETAYIELSASPEQIPADGKSSLIIKATLYDSTGKVMPNGTEATFRTSSGIFLNGSTSYTLSTLDDSGVLYVSLISSTASGSADISCTSNNVSQLTTVFFTGSDTGIGSTTSISLSASPTSIPADGQSSSTITVTLTDSTGQPVLQGTSMTLTTTLGSLSSTNVATVDDTGVVSVALISGTEAGTARVVCTSNGITQATTVVFTGGSSDNQTPAYLTLALSQISVKTDNSDSTTITATVLDADYAVMEGIPVSFTADGGQLSSSLVETDENGEAAVTFSSGTFDKSNRIVTVTADVSQLDPRTIPVQVVGSTISLADNGTDLILDDETTDADESNSSELTITVKDAGGNPIYDASLSITLPPSQTGSVTWTPLGPYTTDINGQLKLTVQGERAGSAQIIVEGVGVIATKTYSIAVLADSFGIVTPSEDLTSWSTDESVTVLVRAPNQSQVKFATSIGGLDGGDLQVLVKNVVEGYVSVQLTSDLAGLATVEVSDNDNPDTVDRVLIVFTRPDYDAATILLQSNTSVIAPTVGDNESVAELTAYVKTSGDTGNQAVAGVPVVFSITDSTGSGERVSPVIVYTNEAGEAKTTFTAGSLGSDAEGVTINARVADSGTTGNMTNISFVEPNIIQRSSGSFLADGFQNNQQIKVQGSIYNDGYFFVENVTANTLTLDSDNDVFAEGAGADVVITALLHSTTIVIGGTSGSVVIGRGAGDSIQILNPTTYSLYMSVLVSDLNGNPVPGAKVSLNLWPEFYNTGVWYDYNDRVSDHYVPYFTGTFYNEDENENTFLDPGEDTNSDSILTPPNSAAGNIPTILTTDSGGLAEFDLVYLKSSAMWIYVRIIATTMVFGTETKSIMRFTLPAEKAEAEAGYLPDSAYPYVLHCPSGGNVSFRLPSFGSAASDDTFIPIVGIVSVVPGSEGPDTDGDGDPDYRAYNYQFNDVGSVSGTIYYDYVSVSDALGNTTFPLKIIIQ
ncbi:exported hypothetical protein [Desulfamplus magnetovallimortis]|uniref:Big-1 domain-containing protein n=1 Tax=Desulfamplus magnetovallimortis TaxID=1246637 RepID=A0A1W1HIC3_9BACT|nr:invasin domain 3-containing protein [Desulfamplus magnetovallimortis]SLM32190.1 exported hypothetical protein [Desulfamplus magnetovallimortis]